MPNSAHRLAATVLSVALAGSVLTAVTPAVAKSSTCTATELRLPDGTSANASSQVKSSDDTGRYQVGTVQLPDGSSFPVLWSDGVPQQLDADSNNRDAVMDVNSDGTVLGVTVTEEGPQLPWLYSNGSYKYLEAPAGMDWLSARAINNRGDVVGNGFDNKTAAFTAIVWPAGGVGQQLLGTPTSGSVDIDDSGAVVGYAEDEKVGSTGVLWRQWDEPGVPITGRKGEASALNEIRGTWIRGSELSEENFTSVLWTTQGPQITPLEARSLGLNSSGDVAMVDDKGVSFVERRDGTRYEFPERTLIRRLIERGHGVDAVADTPFTPDAPTRAILWSGCS
ncbi:hypothetical protein [Kribbella speibonae]|uniref:Uncharacterized protein n=1 Tax=Kribbella speibonae TaxID=1572660 RepID=A0ABY1ZWD9_9ACTN|nr:hypothetical protein [Kribbella speibonae]TCC18933.1 hypothetical protein E0H58_34375 [Kribbella speibonae]